MSLDFAGFGVLVALDADGLARALPGAGIGGSTLAPHGQPAAVPDAPVAVDGLQALEVGLIIAAQIALDEQTALGDGVNQRIELLGRHVLSAHVRVEVGLLDDPLSGRRANTVNIWQ